MKLRVRNRSGATNYYGRRRNADSTSAFTLIEVAICLGVIAFALVAIIGILPAGLQVQRDNREDTIINQEGTYLLEAIKNGAEGLNEFARRVDLIVITNVTQAKEERRYDEADVDKLEPHEVVGLLGTPSDETDNLIEVRAVIGAGAGALVDMNTALAFRYQVTIRNFAYTNSNPQEPKGFQQALAERTRDIRLDVRWPIRADGKPGIGRQNFRSLASGYLIRGEERVRGGGFPWYLRQKQ
jgi:type II secretory pathway pseudopilin PulG